MNIPHSFACSRSRSGSVSDDAHPVMSPTIVKSRSKRKSMTKRVMAERELKSLEALFGDRFSTTGMRGETVLRVKVKTKKALKCCTAFAQTLAANIHIVEVSCPLSRKKRNTQIEGFLMYIRAANMDDAKKVMNIFHAFNDDHMENGQRPFKEIELNPRKKSDQ